MIPEVKPAPTVIAVVGLEVHPLEVCVKVKVTLPEAIPVTTPVLVTVAMVAFDEDQVPPVEGDNVVVLPVQMVVGPVTDTTGRPFTVIEAEAFETHPVVVLVNVKLAVPEDTPVTIPLLVMDAMAGALDAQVPPVVGESEVVEPAQMVEAPTIVATGLGLTEIKLLAEVAVPQPSPV